MGPSEGARRLGLSARQFRRLRARWLRDGDRAVIHAARGRPSNHRLPEALRARALEIARDAVYEDFGPTLLAEHLERHARGSRIHPSTLRLWLMEAGLWDVEVRQRRHRRRRPRRAARGEMVLMDSSEHDWLEGRGPRELSLVAMIDDATSELFAFFYPRDTGLANREVIARYLSEHGRMGALYVDRAGHFGNWRSAHGSRKAGEDADPVMVNSIMPSWPGAAGDRAHSGALASGERPRRATLRYPAGSPDQGDACGRCLLTGAGESISTRSIHP